MKKTRVLWCLILILYAGGIFALSSLPMTGGQPLFNFPSGDKVLHFLEFGLFYLLAWKAVPRRRFFVAFLLMAFYAGSDEFHQIFVATRTASIFDWLADLTGGAAAAGLIRLYARFPLLDFLRRRILFLLREDEEG
jgi:hypothetical protein